MLPLIIALIGPLLQTAPGDLTIEEMLFQAGVVAVFVIYSVLQSRANAKERAEQAATNAEEREKLSNKHAASLEKQTALMIEFMDRERTQRREIMESAVKTLADNVTAMASAVAELTRAVTLHEGHAVERRESLEKSIDQLAVANRGKS